MKILRDFTKRMFGMFFKQKEEISLGFYGPPNAGKTSLANKICKDWTGDEIGKVSGMAHETRSVQFKEEVEIKYKDKSLKFKLVDTPGIATKIDFENLHFDKNYSKIASYGQSKLACLLYSFDFLDQIKFTYVVSVDICFCDLLWNIGENI